MGDIGRVRSVFMTSASKTITPQAKSGNIWTIADGETGGKDWPAKLKSKEKKYVLFPLSIKAPGGQGRRRDLAMLQQTNSFATIKGWFGSTFLATPAMLTKTGAVAVAAA
jgi:hypothetical protein